MNVSLNLGPKNPAKKPTSIPSSVNLPLSQVLPELIWSVPDCTAFVTSLPVIVCVPNTVPSAALMSSFIDQSSGVDAPGALPIVLSIVLLTLAPNTNEAPWPLSSALILYL